MFPKSASFKPGGHQTPPPFATACSIAARSGCELALGERLSAEEAVAEAGSPVRPIGPGKQHPFSPPQLWVQLPLGPGHALLPPPPRAALGSAAKAALGGGRKVVPRWGFRQKLQDPKAFAPEARPPPPTTEAHQRHHPMKAEPGKKGARVRMRLRKAMLTPRGAAGGPVSARGRNKPTVRRVRSALLPRA